MQEQLSFGSWLKRRRRSLGLTQAELAHQVGYVAVTIRKIEADELRPSLQATERLAQALAIPADERQTFMRFARDQQAEEPPPLWLASLPTSPAQQLEDRPGVATLPDDRQPAAPPPPATAPGNLPTPLTRFIGRQQELAQVARLLDNTRLLTLTGVGGTGKTRLALEAAEGLRDRFPDGVWLIELGPLCDSSLVPDTSATTLGVRIEHGQPVLSQLSRALQQRQALLLLDNCEHLLDACAQLAGTLLQQCAQLSILATSREPLGITGEASYVVPPLAMPPVDATLAQLQENEAVQLFLVRALAVQPQLVVAEEDAPAISAICRHLDGLPLALELAAARVRMMPPAQIAARLDQRFQLLRGGSRTALPHQQTLQATIDWSYELLDEAERCLLRRLAVFAGSWSLEAAEALAGEPEQPAHGQPAAGPMQAAEAAPGNVLELLGRLVEKSLVLSELHGRSARYHMLETIRDYAHEKLRAAGEYEPMCERHLAYYLALAESAEPQLHGAEQLTWLAQLSAEHDNLRAALRWSLAQPTSPQREERGLRLARALWWFWHVRSHIEEGRSWLERGLQTGLARQPHGRRLRAQALARLGWFLFMQTDRGAEAVLEEALALSQAQQLDWEVALTLRNLGLVALWNRQPELAASLLEQSLARWQDLSDSWGQRSTMAELGNCARLQGDHERADRLYAESLALSRQIGDSDGVAYALLLQAKHALWRGAYAQAQARAEEALSIVRPLENRLLLSECFSLLSMSVHAQGDQARAEALLQESLALTRDIDHGYKQAGVLSRLAAIALREQRFTLGAQLARQVLLLVRGQNVSRLVARCLLWLARAEAAELPQAPQGGARLVRLLGAAAALLPPIESQLDASSRLIYAQAQELAREALDEGCYAAAWAEGQAMSIEQAIDYAVQEQD